MSYSISAFEQFETLVLCLSNDGIVVLNHTRGKAKIHLLFAGAGLRKTNHASKRKGNKYLQKGLRNSEKG